MKDSAHPVPLAASIELSTKSVLTRAVDLGRVPSGTRVFLPDLGRDKPADRIRAARALTDAELVPILHVVARRISSQGALDDLLGGAVADAKAREVLLVAGDAAAPQGPFASTLDLLERGRIDAHDLSGVHVAGHPEGLAQVSEAALSDALRRKADWSAATGRRLAIVTQFSFNPANVLRWVHRVRESGIAAPIRLGVAGPTDVKTLAKFAAACGVGNSVGFLRKRGTTLLGLARTNDPDDVVKPLEKGLADRIEGDVSLHVYPFGGVDRSVDWLHHRGSWAARSGVKRN